MYKINKFTSLKEYIRDNQKCLVCGSLCLHTLSSSNEHLTMNNLDSITIEADIINGITSKFIITKDDVVIIHEGLSAQHQDDKSYYFNASYLLIESICESDEDHEYCSFSSPLVVKLFMGEYKLQPFFKDYESYRVKDKVVSNTYSANETAFYSADTSQLLGTTTIIDIGKIKDNVDQILLLI